jgi:IclR family transcriptional regulator, KDG regulon repressor
MIDKAAAILALFTPDQPELAVVEIAALLERPRSSVYRILSRMAQVGFLDQDPVTGRYRVGIKLAGLGEIARHSTSLQRVAWPWLCHVGEHTGETAALMVLSGGAGVTIDVQESVSPVKIPTHLGGRFPLHATAGGKVLIAWKSEAEVGELVRGPLERLTPATITSNAKLIAELELTRTRGYGVSVQEWVPDVCAVAAPVRNHRGVVVAAIAAACPAPRWEPKTVKLMAAVVTDSGARVSGALGYTGRGASAGRPAARALADGPRR